MRTHLKLSLAVAALALSAAAFAQEDPMAKGQAQQQGQQQQSMNQAAPASSTDGKSVAQTKFDALDTNHDGYIDKQEAAVSKPLANEFARRFTGLPFSPTQYEVILRQSTREQSPNLLTGSQRNSSG